MNRIFKIVLSLVTVLISSQSVATEFRLPDYEKVRLENGLTVYLMEQKEVPLIDIALIVKAGAVYDTKAGLAGMTADNLLLGTKKLNKQQFEQQLDFIGAEINSGAGLESSSVSVSISRRDTEKVLPMVFDTITRPAFTQTEFDKYKKRYLSELAQQQESPRAVIRGYFDALLFQGHPYANDQDGSPRSVAEISLQDIKTFHQKWYTPDNAALVVTGDFKTREMLKTIKNLFSNWQGKTSTANIPTKISVPKKAQVLLVNKSDANESTFIIGGPGIPFSNPDYVAISVINTILGGRFTSWLNDELRVNSGLTYGARSRFDTKQLGGSFYISSFTKSETTTEAIDLAIKTYQRLWEKGVDSATLESAKAYVKGQFPPNYETSTNLANLLGDMFIYDFDEKFINSFTDQVNELDGEKSREIIAKYFPKDALQFVIVGKAEDIKQKVSKYGTLLETDIKAELSL